MTNEEAKERLKSVLETGISDDEVLLFTEDYEAIDIAIESLEQEPCEDCISREEAEAIFKNARKSLYELSRKEQVKDFQTREMMLLNAEQFIHLLPSVTPQRDNSVLERVEDCISREEAIKMFADDDYTVNELRNLPSVTPQPRWIPCSERLPEKDGRYLVTCSKIGSWEVDWNIWYNEPNPSWLWEQSVTAWMPLPEPYRGGESE